MAKIRHVVIISVLVLFCLSLFLAKNIFAADSGRAFTLSPPIFELRANPGDRLSEVVSVFNSGDDDIALAATLENLKPMGEKGQVQVIGDSGEGLPSLKDWIKIKNGSVGLKKGETKNLDFSIDVPGNAEPGSHFATILFGTTGTNPSGSGSQVSQKIGTLVLLTVAGTANEKAKVVTFTPQKKFFWRNQEINFNLVINNSGNIYLRPRGFLTITDIFGRKVAQTEIDGKNILPGASRIIPSSFVSKRFFGPYTASLALVYGDTNQNINASSGFWVIPWLTTTIVIVLLVVIILIRKRLWRAIKILAGRG